MTKVNYQVTLACQSQNGFIASTPGLLSLYMECPHHNKDTLEDGSTLICTDCGLVLDDVVLSTVEYVETPPITAPTQPTRGGPLIATKIHQKSYNERNRDRLAAFLSQISTRFGWAADNASIMSSFDKLVSQQLSDFGRGGDRTIAALYLLFGRQAGIPLTLSRISEFIGEPSNLIGKECMTIMQAFPELRFTNQLHRFFDFHMQFANLQDDQEKARLRSLYNRIAAILHASGLDEGRFPEPFAVALAAICIDSTNTSKPSCCNHLCEQAGVSHRTAYKRYTEIKKHLLCKAQHRLPWGSQVKNSNVLAFLDDIVRLEWEVLFEPPAFAKATQSHEERVELIRKVVNKMHDDTRETVNKECEPEEFIVEYLLSIGYTEGDILALPRLSFDLIL